MYYTDTMKNTKHKKAYLKYILALFLFGSNGIIASSIFMKSYQIILLRTLLGSLLLLLIGSKSHAFKNLMKHKKYSLPCCCHHWYNSHWRIFSSTRR